MNKFLNERLLLKRNSNTLNVPSVPVQIPLTQQVTKKVKKPISKQDPKKIEGQKKQKDPKGNNEIVSEIVEDTLVEIEDVLETQRQTNEIQETDDEIDFENLDEKIFEFKPFYSFRQSQKNNYFEDASSLGQKKIINKIPIKFDQAESYCLAGQTIVFVGEFSIPKDTLIKSVFQNGGKNSKSVSKRTSILVYGNVLEDGTPPEQGREYLEAVKYNVTLMNQSQFSEFLKEKTEKSLEANTRYNNNFMGIYDPAIPQLIKQGENYQLAKKTELWTQKYAPHFLGDCIGNENNLRKMIEWLEDWHDVVIKGNKKEVKPIFFRDNPSAKIINSKNVNAKACLLSGPTGIGKTTSVRLIAQNMGYDVREWSAQDNRNKNSINAILGDLKTNFVIDLLEKNNQVQCAYKSKFIIVMNEIDGMSSGDLGGVTALIEAIKTTCVPIFCICNNRMSPKIRTLANYCYDIKFDRPCRGSIANRMIDICLNEGYQQVDISAVSEIASRLGCDLRQTLNYLEMHFKTSDTLLKSSLQQFDSYQKDATVMMGGFEASHELMNPVKFQNLSLIQREDLFFVDYNLIPLLVQQNYLDTLEKNTDTSIKELEGIVQATAVIAESDVVSQSMRVNSNWSLLSNFAFLSSIYPCSRVYGTQHITPRFPDYLGKYSSQRKTTRELRELRITLAPAITGSRFAVKFDYLPAIIQNLVRLLMIASDSSFEKILQFMQYYGLHPYHLKEHLSDLQYRKIDYFSKVPSNVKAKLTRLYNLRFTDDSKKIKGEDKQSKVKIENQPRYDKNLDDVVYSDTEPQDEEEEKSNFQEQEDKNEVIQLSKITNFQMQVLPKKTPTKRSRSSKMEKKETQIDNNSQSVLPKEAPKKRNRSYKREKKEPQIDNNSQNLLLNEAPKKRNRSNKREKIEPEKDNNSQSLLPNEALKKRNRSYKREKKEPQIDNNSQNLLPNEAPKKRNRSNKREKIEPQIGNISLSLLNETPKKRNRQNERENKETQIDKSSQNVLEDQF